MTAIIHKINWHDTFPNNPISNALVERFHLTISEHMRTFNQTTYSDLGNNTSVHSSTKHNAVDLVYGHLELKTTVDSETDSQSINIQLNPHKKTLSVLYKDIHKLITVQK